MSTDTRPNESELSRSELEELKRERLRYTVEYAYEHSPFYRELMDKNGVSPVDIQTFEDLEQLPVVTGDDIRQNQPPITDTYRLRTNTDNFYRPFATSGSTGPPKMIYCSHDEFDEACAAAHRAYQHFGITRDDMILNYFPNVGLNLSGPLSEITHQKYRYSSLPFHHTDFSIDQEVSFIQSHEANVMMSLTSHAHARGQQFVEAGYDPSNFGIEKILLAGEPATEERRKDIEELFGATTYDSLGITEVCLGTAAFECSDSSRLHIAEANVHAEVVNHEGEPLGPGAEGSLTLTKLLPKGTDSSMPLIRYQPGDTTTWHEGNCSCQYEHYRLIKSPVREGWEFNLGAVVLDVSYFEDIIYGHPAINDSVSDYQLHLDSNGENGIDRLEVRISTQDNNYVGVNSVDVSVDKRTETVADELGESFLKTRSTVHETVDIVDAAQIDVRFVENIKHSKGKPDRLIDNR